MPFIFAAAKYATNTDTLELLYQYGANVDALDFIGFVPQTGSQLISSGVGIAAHCGNLISLEWFLERVNPVRIEFKAFEVHDDFLKHLPKKIGPVKRVYHRFTPLILSMFAEVPEQ